MKSLIPALLAGAGLASALTYLGTLPAGHPEIRYGEQTPQDPVGKLAAAIERGDALLALDLRFGALPDLLRKLDVPVDSQALVFSKGSFHGAQVSPQNPRAIYFNDRVAVGWTPGARSIEVIGVDPDIGPVFYTLSGGRLERQQVCLTCHQGPATLGVPGLFVGSVYPDRTGRPSRFGAIITDYRTPFGDRWGGWYVDAKSGHPEDRSNAFSIEPDDPARLEKQRPAYRQDAYLSPVSDIVALMTLEHQTLVMNLITRLNWESRLGTPTVGERAEELAAALCFEGEALLPSAVVGASTFQETFRKSGPLRQFDLQRRLFRSPVSYLVLSESFAKLPATALRAVKTGLRRRLRESEFTPADRSAIAHILNK